MNIFKRNQVVITALVIMIAIAGYLNLSQKNATQSDIVPTIGENSADESSDNISEDSETTVNDNLDSENVDENAEVNEAENTEETTEGTEQSTETATIENSDGTEAAGEALFTMNVQNTTDYFMQVKLDREQTRAKSISLLMDIIDSTNLTEDQKSDAVEQLTDLQDRMEKEAAAEDMLKAQGFSQVVVRINKDGTVDVVVDNEELTDVSKAQLEDVIVRQTGVSVDKIMIVPYKN